MLSSYLSVLRGKSNRCSCVYVFKYIVKWQPVSRKKKLFVCIIIPDVVILILGIARKKQQMQLFITILLMGQSTTQPTHSCYLRLHITLLLVSHARKSMNHSDISLKH